MNRKLMTCSGCPANLARSTGSCRGVVGWGTVRLGGQWVRFGWRASGRSTRWKRAEAAAAPPLQPVRPPEQPERWRSSHPAPPTRARLRGDAHGAGVGVALAHHDAAHGDQRRGGETKLQSRQVGGEGARQAWQRFMLHPQAAHRCPGAVCQAGRGPKPSPAHLLSAQQRRHSDVAPRLHLAVGLHARQGWVDGGRR